MNIEELRKTFNYRVTTKNSVTGEIFNFGYFVTLEEAQSLAGLVGGIVEDLDDVDEG